MAAAPPSWIRHFVNQSALRAVKVRKVELTNLAMLAKFEVNRISGLAAAAASRIQDGGGAAILIPPF